jgi:hypothetical protein
MRGRGGGERWGAHGALEKRKEGEKRGATVIGQRPFKQAWRGAEEAGAVGGCQATGGGRRGTRRGGGWLEAFGSGRQAGDAQSCDTREGEAPTGGLGEPCRVLNRFKPSKSI